MAELHNIICASDIPSLLVKEADYISAHPDYAVLFRRYFLSSRGQKDQLNPSEGKVSFVIQPVMGDGSVAVWIYMVKDCPVELIWHTNLYSTLEGPLAQTREILDTFESDLESSGLHIADNCVRTWFYVEDIDNNYSGVVVARRENFETHGMTSRTHYLASTGIGGAALKEGTAVQMDALSIRGNFSQHYLYAPDNFNPTHEYGVTFERGVVVEYGGESHVYISGTASINNKGEIVHPGDVAAQTLRMLENVEALLREADKNPEDMKMMVIYLRYPQDYEAVSGIFRSRFGSAVPYVITYAPVCRPGWLVEMECIAL